MCGAHLDEDSDMKTRCAWTEGGDENYITYHDEEWVRQSGGLAQEVVESFDCKGETIIQPEQRL